MITHRVVIGHQQPVEVSVADQGSGRPILLLHGGAGPPSVAGLGQMLSQWPQVRVLSPTHPGFNGTPRPEWLNSVSKLADVYAQLLEQLELRDVTVIGNSLGGWIAAELALRPGRRLGHVVLVDALGIVVEEHPPADLSKIPPAELAKYSFYNPALSPLNIATMTDQQKAGMAANRATLAAYSGPSGLDPTLRSRLKRVEVPTLVVWGDSDRIVVPEYGRALAAAIPNADFLLLAHSGHLPQIETPGELLSAIGKFTAVH
ncbi:MAG: alpha/beta fold hydrolase [Thermoplasmata archaeon]